jgi:hypothetical protein
LWALFCYSTSKKRGEGKKRQAEWWDTDSVDSVKPLGKYERNE